MSDDRAGVADRGRGGGGVLDLGVGRVVVLGLVDAMTPDTGPTATKIQRIDGWKGVAAVYRFDPPLRGWPDREPTEYAVVSVRSETTEVGIFPAAKLDPDGEGWESWWCGHPAGGDGWDVAGLLWALGYEVVDGAHRNMALYERGSWWRK